MSPIPHSDAYDPQLSHGNIFQRSLVELKKSNAYLKVVELANSRTAAICSSCKYYGSCSGFFMAEATPEQRYYDSLGLLKCGVAQPLQQYIEQILINAGLADMQHECLLTD
jgi:uncharacterized protein